MRNITMLVLLLFIIPITAIAHGPSEYNKSDKIDIDSSDAIEKCVKIKSDQILEYSFEATKPLIFNLHYHLLDETVFHVKEETTKRKEVFHPVKGQKFYCMEWKNSGSEVTTLDYRYSVE